MAPAPAPAQVDANAPAGTGGQAGPGAAAGSTAPAPTTHVSQYPLAVRSHDDVSVVLDRRPERIITFGPSITESVFGVGAGGLVVGVDTYSDWPKPAIDKIPHVGDLFAFNLEKIVALHPDVILTLPAKDIVPKMREVGLKVVVVDAANLQEIYNNLQMIGQITDRQDAAAQVVADMQTRIAAIDARITGVKERPRVFYEVWDDPLMTVGPGSFLHDMIVRTGGINVAASTNQAYPTVSLEAMIKADPQIILTSDAQWAKDVLGAKFAAWVPTSAALTGKVFALDPSVLEHSSQRIVEGFEAVARIIHPEVFR